MNSGSPYSITPVVRTLIIICVALWLLSIGAGESGIDLSRYLGLFNFDSPFFQPWQLVTHLFMHDTKEPFHLFFNMLGLWMFGSSLERFWGSKRFLIYFLLTGIGAGTVPRGACRADAWAGGRGGCEGRGFPHAGGRAAVIPADRDAAL